MKSLFWLLPAAAVAAVLMAQTQAQSQAPPAAPQGVQSQTQQAPPAQVYGRGRGGLPWAWNDRNKDGICDLTGQPVGQDRPIGFGRGRAAGWGRGAAAAGGWGRGRGPCGAGLARGAGWWRGAVTAAPAPSQAPPVPPRQQ